MAIAEQQALERTPDDPLADGRSRPARGVRTCVGCRQTASGGQDGGQDGEGERLVRLVLVPDYEPGLVPDLACKLPGRGVWVHARRACIASACRRGGIARSLRRPIKVDSRLLVEQLRAQLEARASGLVCSAVRKRAAALGTDAVRKALGTGAARLLVVAHDAAGRRGELSELATQLGCPVFELRDKLSLGRLTGRETLGILAISDAGIATEIGSCARQLTGLAEGE